LLNITELNVDNNNLKKPALTKVQRLTHAMFLWLIHDLELWAFIPK